MEGGRGSRLAAFVGKRHLERGVDVRAAHGEDLGIGKGWGTKRRGSGFSHTMASEISKPMCFARSQVHTIEGTGLPLARQSNSRTEEEGRGED